MSGEYIARIQQLLKDLAVAEGEVAKAETLRRTLQLKNGQDTISCGVGTLRLDLTRLGRDYMPQVVQGRQALLALLQKEAHDHVLACRSKVEGIRFQIRKATGSPS